MDFVPVAALALLVTTLISWLRYAVNRDVNGVVTIASAWSAGIVATFLVAQTDFASGIFVGDQALSDLNVASLVFVGLTAASSGVFANEIRGAIDNTTSTRKPSLIDGDDDIGVC